MTYKLIAIFVSKRYTGRLRQITAQSRSWWIIIKWSCEPKGYLKTSAPTCPVQATYVNKVRFELRKPSRLHSNQLSVHHSRHFTVEQWRQITMEARSSKETYPRFHSTFLISESCSDQLYWPQNPSPPVTFNSLYRSSNSLQEHTLSLETGFWFTFLGSFTRPGSGFP